MTEQATPQTETFESLLQQLDAAVNRLESANLSLEEALACYEEAVDLAVRCTRLLDGAELRVRQIDARLAAVDAQLDQMDDGDFDEEDDVPFD